MLPGAASVAALRSTRQHGEHVRRLVDNGVGGPFELVIEPARDKPPDKLRGRVSAVERKVNNVPFDALIGKPAMDALDKLSSLAHRPHDGLGILRQTPLRRSEGFGKAKALEFLHAAD